MATTDHPADTYDGIIIGAGQHGLILGTYLARAGLRVLLVERRLRHGGGLSTEERTLPGFQHNLHSINHFSVTSTPWFRDLGLSARVRYLTPRYEFAQPHRDGSALVFSRDLDETLASIGRFSKADADTFREWNAKAEEMTQRIFLRERFSEPLSPADRDELLGRTALGRDFLELTRRQPGEVVEELFTDERVKVLFLFKLSLFGTVLHETLGTHSPLGSLIRAFDLTTGYELCAGGSWNLARGLMEEFIAAGGHFVNQAHVERIVVEGGRATGIELADGRSMRARQFVASTLDLHQTLETLVGRDQLPADYLARLDKFHYTGWTLFGLHLALDEAPAYTSAAFDPHVNGALKYNIGSETIASLMAAHDDVDNGRVPSNVQFGAGALSVLDPSQAPPGKHTAYAWHVVPWAPDGDHENLRRMQGDMAASIMDRWREYAPNLTDATVLGSYTYTAYEYAQELINMRHGDIFMGALSADQVLHNHFGYRTPLPNLYLAGSACHPNGAISGGAGYIAAGVIARDLGVEPWWQPMDARTELSRLGDG
ncbi:phytoene desaturase family protein [Micromonospora sp. LOL_021]|uniref:phytoene desaturase family protein n=1 Tax=Micromonospora sp. LOL_021 TaxID=3345417 RepID=UPI003A86E62C